MSLFLLAMWLSAAPPTRIDWRAVDLAIECAARETDRQLALAKLRAELDEVVRRNAPCR